MERKVEVISSKAKGLGELRIPAYAVVDTSNGNSVELVSSREEAGSALKYYKEECCYGNELKIVKLKAEKWVR